MSLRSDEQQVQVQERATIMLLLVVMTQGIMVVVMTMILLMGFSPGKQWRGLEFGQKQERRSMGTEEKEKDDE